MKEIGDQEFDSAVAGGAVLVDFGAEWCGPCRVMEPMMAKLAAEYSGRLSVYTVDTEKEPELAARQGVMSLPTFIIFKGGRPVERIVGALSERDFRKKLEPHVGA